MTLLPANTHQSSQNIPEHWKQFAEMAKEYISKRKSDSTKRCYKNDFSLFTTWCRSIDADSIPCLPEVVTMYIAHIANAGKKVSTIERRLAAIRFAHKSAGYESPTNAECVRAALEGIRRTKGCAPQKKAAARVEHVVAMIAQCPESIGGMRDRALFAVCLAGAYRGSEPLSINIEDLESVPEGYITLLRRAKNDQEGKGKLKGIMNGQHIRCADLLRMWLKELADVGITSGPIFRPVSKIGKIEVNPENYRLGYRSFYNLLKRYALKAGFNPDVFGTHSLRRGFVTESFEHEADMNDTLGVTGQASFDELIGYKETSDLFKKNPGRLFL